MNLVEAQKMCLLLLYLLNARKNKILIPPPHDFSKNAFLHQSAK